VKNERGNDSNIIGDSPFVFTFNIGNFGVVGGSRKLAMADRSNIDRPWANNRNFLKILSERRKNEKEIFEICWKNLNIVFHRDLGWWRLTRNVNDGI
jgi:hypothetical protein